MPESERRMVEVCPDCGGSNFLEVVQTADPEDCYRCYDCDTEFAETDTRPERFPEPGHSGLARELSEMDADAIGGSD